MNKSKFLSMRANDSEIKFFNDAAKKAGMTRTDFIFSAAKKAAQEFGIDPTPYFVSETKSSPQNMRTSFFRPEGDQKIDIGDGNGAASGRGAIAKQKTLDSENKRSVKRRV